MILGNPSIFALKSDLSRAFAQPSFRALGSFVIHICGASFGIDEPDASMLACSLDEVKNRIARRGTHTAPFAVSAAAHAIAASHYAAFYEEEPRFHPELGLSRADLRQLTLAHHLCWAPDGDEAFDDGSFVLQFDIEEQVRLVAFKVPEDESRSLQCLRDLLLPADTFYQVLQQWYSAVEDLRAELLRAD